jgi:hypothetical protein
LEEKSKLFLILCLHRSGSSATAGVMHHLGIHMGDKLLPATAHNPKGHYENAEFVSINQQILQAAHSTWNNPPSRDKIAGIHFPDAKIKAFLINHVKPVWGLKDPRALFTFEVWKPYLEEVADIYYVFVHRPFKASVSSLAKRDRISISRANQILTPYLKNLYLYRHTYGLPSKNIIDISYQDLLNDPDPFVRKLNEKIGNSTDHQLNQVREFLDSKLKNF